VRVWHVVAAFVVGAALGHLAGVRGIAVAQSARPAPEAAPASARVAPPFDAAPLTAEVRHAVAEACRAAPAPPAAIQPSVAAPVESLEAVEAHDRAQALLVTALAAGAWTEADVLALRPLVGRMTGEQREEVLGKLVPALNEGRLRATIGPGPPF
jgi:hypothetical protein